jgi:hypothetical protein
MLDDIQINNDIDLPDGLILAESMEWMKRARCRGVGTEAFFVERGAMHRAQEAVKLYCSLCVVRTSCLNFALDNNCKGLWGGVSEKNRRALARDRKIA